MNAVEVHGMLRYMQPHERYLVVDDITVSSWLDVLSVAPDLDSKWAQAFLRDFYGKNAGGMSASVLLSAWREREASRYWREQSQVAAIESAPVGVEAPEWFREARMKVGLMPRKGE